jgi:pSer/pThr/pTyr-binding forkhead associated (FHA) protein
MCPVCGAHLGVAAVSDFEAESTSPSFVPTKTGISAAVAMAATLPATKSPATRIPPPVPMPEIVVSAPPMVVTSDGVACTRCNETLQPGDRFCRMCGLAQADSAPPMANPRPLRTQILSAVTSTPARLMLVRGNPIYGSHWRLAEGDTWLGRGPAEVSFPADACLALKHARLFFHGGALWLDPLSTRNGVFVRIREPARLRAGDEFSIGAQRFRVMADSDRPRVAEPGHDGTSLYGTQGRKGVALMLLRLGNIPALNEVIHRPQRLLSLGRAGCDVNIANDGFVSERHAQLTQLDDGDQSILLEDTRSRNGTYLRIRRPQRMQHGDLLLVGEQVLRIELTDADV